MNEREYLAERFEEHRTHLRAVAYRMLGSLSDVDSPAAKAYQQAMFQQSQPAAMFFSDDVQADYERMNARGAEFTHAANGRDGLQDRDAEGHLRLIQVTQVNR